MQNKSLDLSIEELEETIQTLNSTVWEDQAQKEKLSAWLSNFNEPNYGNLNEQKLHAMYLLSQFMYFGIREIRELMRHLYQESFKYPLIRHIRKTNGNIKDLDFLYQEYEEILRKSRFLGMGNPSESGAHLLYYFRQENKLDKDLFINALDIFDNYSTGITLKDPQIENYVFIDDFCGSGKQAESYSEKILTALKNFKPTCKVYYFLLFGTQKGIEKIKSSTKFDHIEAVYSLDESFKCFSDDSRFFIDGMYSNISKDFAKHIFESYGSKLWPAHPLGYKDGQNLIGFYHNTPDNTLPVIWFNEDISKWKPIFKRYHKLSQ